MKVTALIPAYNEAERIGETIEAVAKIEGVGRIVVINDGSTDATAQIALNYPVELINLPDNRGKGEALNADHRPVATFGSVDLLLDLVLHRRDLAWSADDLHAGGSVVDETV